MGRITIFSAEGCPHCQRVMGHLQARGIPYHDISVTLFPSRRNDMITLSHRTSTPQVFFNTRHVGGADDTIQLLEQWDVDPQYGHARQKFEQEILPFPDPNNPRLALATGTADTHGQGDLDGRLNADETIEVVPGNKQPLVEIVEDLKRLLPRSAHVDNLTTYKHSFTGRDAVNALMQHYQLDRASAVDLGRRLQNHHAIWHHVLDDSRHEFGDTGSLFRLHCDHTPQVLNSYRVWTQPIPDDQAQPLIRKLSDLLRKIETLMTDSMGQVDLVACRYHELYPTFEAATCQVQGVDLAAMDDRTKIAFGLNLYNLMIKYAFIKIGTMGPTASNLERLGFFSNIKFNVGGQLFSFLDWENGILRGNKKASYAFSAPFGSRDPRRSWAVQRPDGRIHFGMNCGAHSCPPVNFFNPETIDEELALVAASFCEDDENVHVDVAKGEITLSKIFSWYRADFCERQSQLPSAVVRHLRGYKKQALERLMENKDRPIKVLFRKYDWAMPHLREQVLYDAETLHADKKSVFNLIKLRGKTKRSSSSSFHTSSSSPESSVRSKEDQGSSIDYSIDDGDTTRLMDDPTFQSSIVLISK